MDENTIEIIWPANATPVVGRRWRRLPDGRISGTYTRRELAWALMLMMDRARRELEARLERGMRMIRDHQQDDDLYQRLLRQWDKLIDRHQAILDGLPVVAEELNKIELQAGSAPEMEIQPGLPGLSVPNPHSGGGG